MPGALKIDKRRKKILEQLQRDGQVRVSRLSEQLGTTAVTIRNDLDALERDGYLERTQGGAIQTTKNYYNLEFLRRKQKHMSLKKAIAALAASKVHDGNTLFINSGTTTYYTAIELKRRKNLNIVTNSIAIANELGDVPTFRVILLGGEINSQYSFTYGEAAREQLCRFNADFAILSFDGISAKTGLSTYHAEESVIDRTMMERARQTLIVADSFKLDRESFYYVCDMNENVSWITDEGANSVLAEGIIQKGVKIYFTKP